jgi:hypothetical protein
VNDSGVSERRKSTEGKGSRKEMLHGSRKGQLLTWPPGGQGC